LIEPDDLDPSLLLYGLCRRADISALPNHRVGVARSSSTSLTVASMPSG
jgi:hypothetical protein